MSSNANKQQVTFIPEGQIICFISGKLRKETQEEYVRQNLSKRLVNELKYPRSRLAVEFGIKVGSSTKRIDIAAFAEGVAITQENILIAVECKKESVSPLDKENGVDQLKSYMAACLNCEWGLWTNGKQRQVFRKIQKGSKQQFIEFIDIPDATGENDVDRPLRKNLIKPSGDNLLFAFRASHNHIHANDGYTTEKSFFEFLKLIFCKILDERDSSRPHVSFHAKSSELNSTDGQLVCKQRIEDIFTKVKKVYPDIFAKNEILELEPRSITRIVSELQGYNLSRADIDIKGKAYEEIVGANLKGDRGQFFTPRNVMRMAISMLDPKEGEKILDPSCGTGGFLVTAFTHILKQLEIDFTEAFQKPRDQWDHDEYADYQNKVKEMAESSFFGFDIAKELVRAARMNMVMNNDGNGNMLMANSLLPPFQWEAKFRENLENRLSSKGAIKNHNDIGLFDVIVTNPPFGAEIPVVEDYILVQFSLGHIWEKPKLAGDRWVKTGRTQSSVPPEQLFIERCIQLLKPGGRMAMVLPDSILGSPGLGYIRQWLTDETKIVASIDMHGDTFQPHTGVQTSVLIIQKKTEDEKAVDPATQGRVKDNYRFFAAMIEKVGHDKRGNPVYVRDESGNETLIQIDENVIDVEHRVDDKKSVATAKSAMHFEKILNDQTLFVPDVFAEWKRKEGIAW